MDFYFEWNKKNSYAALKTNFAIKAVYRVTNHLKCLKNVVLQSSKG